MRAKKLKCCLLAGLIFVLIASAAVYAASMYRLSYVEKFETGKVDIRIQEITAVKEGQNLFEQQLAEANEDLSYVPRIINRAADCYVRAKVVVEMDGECEEPLSEENIYGLGKDWIRRGEYFYCTEILTEGQATNLFEGLHIPENWEYGNANGFDVKIKAEAVQSVNFRPDFNDELPWGAVELEAVASAEGSECIEATPVSVISNVEYDSAGGFQCRTSDLFDEFNSMMPGTCCEKTVNIKNTSGNTLRATLNIAAEESDLNNKMTLKVLDDKKEIYSGTITDTGLKDDINISDIPKSETGKITFRMCLPADADNYYNDRQDNVVWEFNVEEIADDGAQTGDLSNVAPFIIIAAFALLLMLCAKSGGRKEEHETNN